MKNQKALFNLFKSKTGKKEHEVNGVQEIKMPWQVSRVNEYHMRD